MDLKITSTELMFYKYKFKLTNNIENAICMDEMRITN